MEKRYYSADTLQIELRRFEDQYGCPSGAFYRAWQRDDFDAITYFDGVVWADTYREYLRLSGTTSSPVPAPQPVH